MTAALTTLAASSTAGGLTPAGWAMMIGSVGLVLGLCAFCVYRALKEPHPEEHMHAPLDIDTHDLDDE
ncbi:MAG: hypothetical protein JXQ73_08525 [Phycisphaerae bacterium]|nr:hypothetical protein [Phycisphaerae bacterium]